MLQEELKVGFVPQFSQKLYIQKLLQNKNIFLILHQFADNYKAFIWKFFYFLQIVQEKPTKVKIMNSKLWLELRSVWVGVTWQDGGG